MTVFPLIIAITSSDWIAGYSDYLDGGSNTGYGKGSDEQENHGSN
jgi:hypothetical protein